MNPQVCITIPNDTSIAMAVKILKPIEAMPISEISQRIRNSEPLLSYDMAHSEGIQKIILCYESFKKQGITPELFEHNRPTTIAFLRNLSTTYQEISDYVNAEMDAEEDDEE